MKLKMVFLLALPLTGCVAMKPAEIRGLEGEQYTSNVSVDSSVTCMRTYGADYVTVTTYPDSKRVEYSVETIQMGSLRVLYMANAEQLPEGGTSVVAKFSGQNSWSLTEKEFRSLLRKCMPPKS